MNSGAAGVTIVIPTYNREDLLKIALSSALDQEYPNFNVIVLDNASTDNTSALVESYSDSRIRYIRNHSNVGIFRNFCRAIKYNSSPYVNILQDDDVLLPGFIQQTVSALESHPKAAMSIPAVEAIDLAGRSVELPDDPLPNGSLSGLDYLESMVDGKNWVIHMSGVMMRSEAVLRVGGFDNTHSGFLVDPNLFFRLAASFDLVFLPGLLYKVRQHEGQDTAARFRVAEKSGPLATLSDRIDAVALLLKSIRAEDINYRCWLAERLLHLNARRSDATAAIINTLNITWEQQLELIIEELTETIPEQTDFILVDDEKWRPNLPASLNSIPFLEYNGLFNGAPSDDTVAIEELERLRKTGISFLVVGRPAFWWLDYYSGLRNHLNSFDCLIDNSRLKIFKL